MLLRRIPSREELTSAAALTFVAKPKECEVDFPFGSIISSAPASSDDEEPEQPPKRRRSDNPDNAEPGTSEKLSTSKYNPSVFSNMRGKFPNNIKFLLPKNMNTNFWKKKYLELSSLAIASSSWKSRLSSFNKLKTQMTQILKFPGPQVKRPATVFSYGVTNVEMFRQTQ